MEWMDEAACKGSSEFFYADSTDKKENTKKESQAKIICKKCPVSAECLLFAIENDESFGIWGSFAPKERSILTSLFSKEKIDIDFCRNIVNVEIRSIKAKILKNELEIN